MSEYILSALILGLTAGIQPDPLSILVVQKTFERGLIDGIKVSFAPVITDGPIIFAAVVVLTQFKDISMFIGLLSLVGGLYLGWLCIKILQVRQVSFSDSNDSSSSLLTAAKVNLLSPNPYLFWFTVGGAYFALGATNEALAFVLVFLSCLVLANIALAVIASKFCGYLESRMYLWLMHALGVALGMFAISFLAKSYGLLIT